MFLPFKVFSLIFFLLLSPGTGFSLNLSDLVLLFVCLHSAKLTLPDTQVHVHTRAIHKASGYWCSPFTFFFDFLGNCTVCWVLFRFSQYSPATTPPAPNPNNTTKSTNMGMTNGIKIHGFLAIYCPTDFRIFFREKGSVSGGEGGRGEWS